MREIKFRGKRVDNGRWVEGSLVFNPENKYPTIGDIYSEYDEWMKVNVWRDHYVKPETIGQFTGLTDKNGTEIFEGDLIRGGQFIRKVEWFLSEWSANDVVRGMNLSDFIKRCERAYHEKPEVIGNIHDNKPTS